jgi:hypothetical protein
MRVGVFGTGHVGLPTAAALAHLGHDVVATDVDAEKLSALSVGRLPFYEPGLEDLVRGELASGRLRFSANPTTTTPKRARPRRPSSPNSRSRPMPTPRWRVRTALSSARSGPSSETWTSSGPGRS